MSRDLNAVRQLATLVLTIFICSLISACAPGTGSQTTQKWAAVRDLSTESNHDAAIAEAQKLLQIEPDNPGTLYWLANAYLKTGQTEEAEKAYGKIINKTNDPDWIVGSHIKMAWIYHTRDTEKALRHSSQALKVKPLMGDALILQGWEYIFQGRYRQALTDFEHILENPGVEKSYILNFNMSYEGHRGKASALFGLGRTEKALTELTLAESAAKNWSAEWDRALIYYATNNEAKLQEIYGGQGLLNAKIKDYTGNDGHKGVEVVAVTVGGPADLAGVRAGDILLQIGGESFGNTAEFQTAVRSCPAGQSVPIHLLRDAHPLKLSATLASYLDVVMNWAPQQPIIVALLAQREALEQIDREENSGNLREALQLCLNHLKTAPAGGAQGPLKEKSIRIARRLDPPPAVPEEAVRHAARAEAYLKSAAGSEEFKKALAEFDAALLLAPWWADAWFNLGVAQKNSGDPVGAIHSLRMFLLAAPDDRAAPQVQREIYSLEVEAEQIAGQGQWIGQWADVGGSRYRMSRTGDLVTFTYIQPDQTDTARGFRPGDLKFSGTLTGNRLRGKRVFLAATPDESRCFGATYEKDMTGELEDNGFAISARWMSSNFLIKSCQRTTEDAQVEKYFRLP